MTREVITTPEPRTCTEAEPFALQVTDNAMEPEFQQGCIIIIDPTGHARDGAFVLASVNEEYIFRRLRIDGDAIWLEALREGFATIPLTEGLGAIDGVVVQRAGTRRRDHKRYD